jgi:hypothetical protein
MNEARRIGVFRKRVLANGGAIEKASPASQSVPRTLNEAPNYAAASARTHTGAGLPHLAL